MSYRISPNNRYKLASPPAGTTPATSNHANCDTNSCTNSNSNSPNQIRPTRASPKSAHTRTDHQVKEEPAADRISVTNEDETTQELTDNQDDSSSQSVQPTANHHNNHPANHQPANHHPTNHHSANQPSTPTSQQISPDRNPDVKSDGKSDGKPDAKPNGNKDSPAFRLRTRRSTPRKLDSIYSSPYSTSRKTSLYSPTNSDQLQAKVAKLRSAPAVNDVKRNLFDASRPAAGRQETAKKGRSHSPSRSLVEDVDLNVFAENIRVEKLTETGKNSLNYLCLRIIEVQNEECLTECSPECSNGRTIEPSNNTLIDSNDRSNDHPSSPHHPSLATTTSPSPPSTGDCPSCPKQRLLKLYCQQAETKSVLNAQKPVVLLQLLNEYCSFKDRLQAGRILEIVKFEVKQLPEPANYRYAGGEVPIYPFYIEVAPNKAHHWVSYLSIKKRFEPTNSNLLNVINTQNRHQMHIEDQPPTKNSRVVFTSYVVNETASNEQVGQPLKNTNMKNTNSPTIRRFMKKIKPVK